MKNNLVNCMRESKNKVSKIIHKIWLWWLVIIKKGKVYIFKYIQKTVHRIIFIKVLTPAVEYFDALYHSLKLTISSIFGETYN